MAEDKVLQVECYLAVQFWGGKYQKENQKWNLKTELKCYC